MRWRCGCPLSSAESQACGAVTSRLGESAKIRCYKPSFIIGFWHRARDVLIWQQIGTIV